MKIQNCFLFVLSFLGFFPSSISLAQLFNHKHVKQQVKKQLAKRKNKRFKLIKATCVVVCSGVIIPLCYGCYYYYDKGRQLNRLVVREQLRIQNLQPPLQELRVRLEADSPDLEQVKSALEKAESVLHDGEPNWKVVDISKHTRYIINWHWIDIEGPSSYRMSLNNPDRIRLMVKLYKKHDYRKLKQGNFFGGAYFLAQENYLLNECTHGITAADVGARLLTPDSYGYSHNIVRFLRDEVILVRAFSIDSSLNINITIENHMPYDIPITLLKNQIICNYPEDLDDYFSLKIIGRGSSSLMRLPKSSRHTFSLPYELIRGSLNITTPQDLFITDFIHNLINTN